MPGFILHPRRLANCLLVITFLLVSIHLLCVYTSFMLERPCSFAWKFYFDKRMNIPFFFSVGLLLLCVYFIVKLSVSPLEIASRKEWWKALTILTAFFTIDKLFHLHNKARTTTSNIIDVYDPTAPLYYVWTIPYIAFIAYLFLRLRRSFTHLPDPTKKQLTLAGVLLIIGGIVLELTGVYYAHLRHGKSDVYHVLIKTAEELFQMLGLVTIIYAVTSYYQKLRRGDA